MEFTLQQSNRQDLYIYPIKFSLHLFILLSHYENSL